MYAKDTVNVRSLPSTDGSILGSLSKNTEVTVTGQCNETGWYRIQYNGSIGYVSNSYLGTEKVAESSTTDNSSSNSSSNSGASSSSSSGGVNLEDLEYCPYGDTVNYFYFLTTGETDEVYTSYKVCPYIKGEIETPQKALEMVEYDEAERISFMKNMGAENPPAFTYTYIGLYRIGSYIDPYYVFYAERTN